MEAANFVPGKVCYAGKFIQSLELGSSRSEDHPNRFMSSCRLDQCFSRGSRSSCAGCFTSRMDLYFQTPHLAVLRLDRFFSQLWLLISCSIIPEETVRSEEHTSELQS